MPSRSAGRDGAITRDQALAHARAVVDATDLPVSADLENGFGDDPATVAETIRLAAAAGLAGCSIEDASGDRQKPIYDRTLAVERVAAAVEAARSLPFPFTLTARAENYLHGRPDLDDTLDRLRAFETAGADVLYAPGLPDLAAIRTVCEAVTRPVNVLAASGGQRLTVEELAAAGVRRISLGAHLSRAALGAFLRAAREIKETAASASRRTRHRRRRSAGSWSAGRRGAPSAERPEVVIQPPVLDRAAAVPAAHGQLVRQP